MFSLTLCGTSSMRYRVSSRSKRTASILRPCLASGHDMVFLWWFFFFLLLVFFFLFEKKTKKLPSMIDGGKKFSFVKKGEKRRLSASRSLPNETRKTLSLHL